MLRAGLAISVLAVVIYGIVLWFNQLSARTPPASEQHQPSDIDYQLTGFKAVLFDAQGLATQHMEGDQLRHYPFNDKYVIDAPRGVTLQGQQQWQLRSQRATSEQDLSELHWLGDVHVQQAQRSTNTMSLRTEHLVQRPRQHQAQSDTTVHFDANLGEISANAMQLDTMNNQLTLTGRVNGIYQAP